MPLDDYGPNTAWPPSAFKKPLEVMKEHASWYAGNKADLREVHRTKRRRWWSTETTILLARNHRLHVPLASDIAATSADLLFSEAPTFDHEDQALQDRLSYIVDEDGWEAKFIEAAETGAALGGSYLRVAWDVDVADHPILTVIQADQALPEFRYGRLASVVFWREVQRDGIQVWRHLEEHRPGAIEHRLFKGTEQALGSAVALTDVSATTSLALPDLVDGTILPTEVDELTATYVPNMLPNRRDRSSSLGRSDYDAVEDLFDSLDEAWSSWMRDIRLGKSRIVAPAEALRDLGAGQGAAFDIEREVYDALPGLFPDDATGMPIKDIQFAIRYEEHRSTTMALVEQAVRNAGYSGATFGITADGGAQTATEIHARERRSMITRAKKGRYWTPALRRIAYVAGLIDNAVFNGPRPTQPPSVQLADSVQERPSDIAATIDLLRRAEAMSRETAVRLIHPEWDDDQVRDEVLAIREQYGTVQDPTFQEESDGSPDF